MLGITTPSEESLIDRRLAELITKLVAGDATPQERDEYVTLMKRRAQLMQPAISRRVEARRAAKAG